jgi:DNA processing protein
VSRTPEVDADAACAAALAGLPGMGPATLVSLLSRARPTEVWAAVRSGAVARPERGDGRPGGAQGSLLDGERGGAGAGDGGRQWQVAARRLDPPGWWAARAAAGIGVTWPGRPDYPRALAGDPQPPGVLFWRGSLAALDGLCVAVVGTRNATPAGRGVAYAMGRDLAAAGVCVVSGLALGIDGAAHSGALVAAAAGARGTTVGVAASGVDVPYPRRHTTLWRQVAEAGAVVSENLPGRPAQAWRFPSRNRVIAGLVALVVVVESHLRGGSLITAEAAIERGVEVRVVPGPVHSPASEGSNQLLYDGPGPVRHARDVLDALGVVLPGLEYPPSGSPGVGPRRGKGWAVAEADPVLSRALRVVGQQPASTSQVMERAGMDAATAMAALQALADLGLLSEDGGWWSPGS